MQDGHAIFDGSQDRVVEHEVEPFVGAFCDVMDILQHPFAESHKSPFSFKAKTQELKKDLIHDGIIHILGKHLQERSSHPDPDLLI